jgi:hypothetical protein
MYRVGFKSEPSECTGHLWVRFHGDMPVHPLQKLSIDRPMKLID